MRLAGAQSGSRELPLTEFFVDYRKTALQPGEIVTHVLIPLAGRPVAGRFEKVGLRNADAISVVCAACEIELDGSTCRAARIGLGAVAAVPVRALAVESALRGREITEEVAAECARLVHEHIAPIDDVRASAQYRGWVAEAVVARLITDTARDSKGVMDMQEIEIQVNGRPMRTTVEVDETLVDVLRHKLGIVEVKNGCGQGDCGACTVLLDGEAINSCLTLAVQADGREVTTTRGLGTAEDPHPLQTAFIEHGAVQCGFCSSGMILAAASLLQQNEAPTRDEIRDGISGNLCRCTGYTKIVDAIEEASRVEVLEERSA